MEFNAVYTVKKEIEKEAFLRELLIKLGTNPDTPVDVVKAKIGEVRESVKEIIVCTAKVSGICNASVGYDRQEPYTDYETFEEKVGDSKVTRQRAVVKYRTVTDWRPFNTEYSGEATCAASNGVLDISDSCAVTAIKTAKANNIVEKGEATVSDYGLKIVVAACETAVEIESVSFPGDHHKDEKYRSTSEIQSVYCYKLPYYEVTFTYDEKDYKAACFACGRIIVKYDVPPKNVDVDAEAKEMTKNAEKKSKQAWWICYVALGITAIICFLIKFAWFWPVPIAALVYAILANRKYNKEYEDCVKTLSSDISTAKIKELKDALSNYGYEDLDSGEASIAEIKTSSRSTQKPKSISNKVVICAILSIILMISSFVVNNNNLHSPKQVKASVVGMTHEHKDDSSNPYGYYYIYTDFKVDAKRNGIEAIDMEVHINDKNGNELGILNTSLEGMNLDAGDSKEFRTTWKENQPERNDFFNQMYNIDINDLEFEIDIVFIRFSDGRYYYEPKYK